MNDAGDSFDVLLRAYRAAANLTQEELAERSGLSVQGISLLERGIRRGPRPSTVTLLAEALGLDAAGRQSLVTAARGRTQTPAEPAPDLLPRAVGDFAGRAAEVEHMRRILDHDLHRAPPVLVLTGPPGVGKTTLALHVAHLLGSRFPHGQLFVDLRGAEGQPLASTDVLAGLLRALGIDGSAIPSELDGRIALFRARLAERRVLLLLDNAAGEAQVRPLLPGAPASAAILTSRSLLSGLEAVHHLPLGVLSRPEATGLLARVAGPERVAAEPQAAADIVQLTGCLPLAVRIAGARLAARPTWSLRSYALRLGDERRRLDELRAGDLEVRASLALSYRALDPEARRGFRLLGLLEALDFPAWLVAGLLGQSGRQAEALLERLVDAHLLETPGEDAAGQVRYRLHSLLRLFARELVTAEDGEQLRRAALARALGAQLALAERAQRALSPGGARAILSGDALRWEPSEPEVVEAVEGDPLTWFEAERASLVAGVVQAARAGLHEPAWELAASLSIFVGIRGYWQDALTADETALRASQEAGDRRGEMQASLLLASVHMWLADVDRVAPCLERAMALARELGDEWHEALGLGGLGLMALYRGELDTAIHQSEGALAPLRRAGDGHGEAMVLYGLGQALRLQGRLADATAALRACHTIFAEEGDRHMVGVAMLGLADLHQSAGRPVEAEHCLALALELFEELGNRLLAALAQHRFVSMRLDERSNDEAIALLEDCVRVFRELGLRHDEARVLRQLEAIRSSVA